MLRKINYLIIILSSVIQINLYAELQGTPGEVFPVLVKPNKAYKNLTVEIDGSVYELLPLPFSKQGQYIEIGDKNIYVIEKDFGESRITIQDSSKVTLSDEDTQRAYKESQLIRKAISTSSTQFRSNFKFLKPVDGLISSRYGKKRYINGLPRSPHLALDIAAPTGTKIISPEFGRVILLGDFFYSGNYVVIDHGHGLITSYSHLSKIIVKEGQLIDKGQKIGEVGSTGRVTGPHLHWTVYLNQVRINPEITIDEDYLDGIL
jgi:murein DD-endopeptidase MepM/ murein hydrolase activator NlpD